ncbi:hypothetical protein BOX15_Mlig033566g1, partial [Macrostomum lignano]
YYHLPSNRAQLTLATGNPMPKKSNSAAASAAAAAAIKSSKAPSAAGKAGAANGDAKFIDSIDPEDPEYQRQLMRPAEIKEDLTLMEQRKRVSLILNSEAFRRELEEIVQSQLKTGGAQPASLDALRQLSDLLAPSASSSVAAATTSVLPVNDLRGGDAAAYQPEERLLRCKLAAVYRLVDLHGWSEGIYNHVTARVEGASEHFLINPFGLEYREITAGSLVKIDLAGDIVDRGCTVFGVNKAGWVLHSAIHSARPDIRAIVHLHSNEALAVANSRCGLLPLCPEALAIMDEVAFHDFHGIVSDESERPALIESIGQKATVLLLRHHGVCVCGATLEEAWRRTELLMTAARIQLESLRAAGGPDNLWLPSEAAVAAGKAAAARSGANGWSFGQLEFEAAMRELDGAGYRTGYVYKEPRLRAPEDRPRKPQKPPTPLPEEEEAVAAPAGDEANAPETAQAAEPDPVESAKEEPVGESGTEQSQPAAEEAEKLNFDQSEQQPEV